MYNVSFLGCTRNLRINFPYLHCIYKWMTWQLLTRRIRSDHALLFIFTELINKLNKSVKVSFISSALCCSLRVLLRNILPLVTKTNMITWWGKNINQSPEIEIVLQLSSHSQHFCTDTAWQRDLLLFLHLWGHIYCILQSNLKCGL